MGQGGLEPASAGRAVTTCGDNNFREPANGPDRASAAACGAVVAPDPALRRVVEAWPTLPKPVRAGIVEMVKAAAGV